MQRAIADERLTKASVGWDRGKPFIKNAELAAEEWEAHTRPRVKSTEADSTGGRKPSGLALATQQEREAKAKLAEFDYQRKIGEYVLRAAYESAEAARVVAARTKMLAVPTRVRQRLPHLSTSDVAVIEAVVREALEELKELAKTKGAGR